MFENMPRKLLQVKVLCAPVLGKESFRGEAEVVSSQNRLGKFDVLPEHTNFITLIFDNLTIHTPGKKKLIYQFERGVLEVSKNQVSVFLGL